MSKAFVGDEGTAPAVLRPLPVGRRPITPAGFAALQRARDALWHNECLPLRNQVAKGAADPESLRTAEHRLRMVERQIALSDVVAVPTAPPSSVGFNTRVVVRDIDTDARKTYIFVGPDETDLASAKISCRSPVAEALYGKAVGERAFVKRPAGMLEVVVEAIEAANG